LRELAGAEELANRSHNRTDVDEADGGRGFLAQAHALFDDALHTHQTHANFGLNQLTHGLHPAIAQMVHVIGTGNAVVDVNHAAGQRHNIVFGDGTNRHGDVLPHALVELIAPDTLQVIALRVKNLGNQIFLRIIQRRRVAGAHATVELDQGFLRDRPAGFGFPARFLTNGRRNPGMVGVVIRLTKESEQLFIRAVGQNRAMQFIFHRCHRAQEDGYRDGTFAVKAQREITGLAGLEFHPGAAVGDHLCGCQAAPAILFDTKIHTRRANQLADHHALGSVDDEGSVFRHQRQIAQENLLFDNFTGLTNQQRDIHIERDGKGEVAVQAFLLIVLRLAETILQIKARFLSLGAGEIQAQQAVVALDRGNLVEKGPQSLPLEPLIRLELHFYQSRQRQSTGNPRIGLDTKVGY